MISLEEFCKPIMVARKPIDGGHRAYKMDSTAKESDEQNAPDMRSAVGLGTCECCDYFLPRNNSIVLIEETQLNRGKEDKKKKLRKNCPYLSEDDLGKYADELIKDEMVLKAYGSMLVLCRLAEKCAAAKKIMRGKKYKFWLVASVAEGARLKERREDDRQDERQAQDNLKDFFQKSFGRIKSGLSGKVVDNKVVDDVAVMSTEDLENLLSETVRLP